MIAITDQQAKLLTPVDFIDGFFPQMFTYAGKTCTGLENADILQTPWDECMPFLKRLLDSKHMSIFEHCVVNLELVTDRTIANQLVRHRIAAYSQQSQRYVKYTSTTGRKCFGIIKPANYEDWSAEAKNTFSLSCKQAFANYEALINQGIKAEDARKVLPGATATKLIASWNIRVLLHVLYDPSCGRFTNKHAQQQTRDLMGLAKEQLCQSKFLNELLTTYEEKYGG